MDAFPNQTVQADHWRKERVLAFKMAAQEVQTAMEKISSELLNGGVGMSLPHKNLLQQLRGLELERNALNSLISNPNAPIAKVVNDAWTGIFPDKQPESEQLEQERYIKAIVTCRLEETVDLENLERIRNNRERLKVLVG